MRHLKHCINPTVIVGLAVVAGGVRVFAPGAFAAALPLLVVAICPLSMIGVMYMMRGGGLGSEQASEPRAEEGPDGRAMEPHETTAEPRPAQG